MYSEFIGLSKIFSLKTIERNQNFTLGLPTLKMIVKSEIMITHKELLFLIFCFDVTFSYLCHFVTCYRQSELVCF